MDVVGDKIRGIFEAQSIGIGSTITDRPCISPMGTERERVEDKPAPFGGRTRHLIEPRTTLVVNDSMAQRVEDIGSVLFRTDMEVPKSAVYVPLLVGASVTGVITIANLDRENAFSESDVGSWRLWLPA